MAVSRRWFLTLLGAGGAGALAIPAFPSVSSRGREASVALAVQGQAQRRADRRLQVRG